MWIIWKLEWISIWFSTIDTVFLLFEMFSYNRKIRITNLKCTNTLGWNTPNGMYLFMYFSFFFRLVLFACVFFFSRCGCCCLFNEPPANCNMCKNNQLTLKINALFTSLGDTRHTIYSLTINRRFLNKRQTNSPPKNEMKLSK